MIASLSTFRLRARQGALQIPPRPKIQMHAWGREAIPAPQRRSCARPGRLVLESVMRPGFKGRLGPKARPRGGENGDTASDVSSFRWGVFGTGAISAKFIAGLASAREAKPVFVASRSREKAEAFAAGVGGLQARSGYPEAASLAGVDAVYIATPPALHAEHALLCIEAGLPVLVEKPFAYSGDDASRIADAARANGVFAMEAMWTRFLPAATAMRERLAAGAIGTVRAVRGTFGTSQMPDPTNGMFDPALGGGAIAHLGTYPLSLAQWMFGEPRDVQALGAVGPSGVEEDASIQLSYAGGVAGSFFVSLRTWALDEFQLLGTEGTMSFCGSIVRPYGLDVSLEPPRQVDHVDFGVRSRIRQHRVVHALAQRTGRSGRRRPTRENHYYTGNGYHYQADEVRACVERGAIESDVMPMSESVMVVRTADLIREKLGVGMPQGEGGR